MILMAIEGESKQGLFQISLQSAYTATHQQIDTIFKLFIAPLIKQEVSSKQNRSDSVYNGCTISFCFL
jgi:hypothetical protein